MARRTQTNLEPFVIPRFDGGLNTKDSKSRIGITESPDALNVVFDDEGSVATRQGSTLFNTQAVGSAPIDGISSYNGSMIIWHGGDMYRASGTTFVTIASAQNQFASGAAVAHIVYQNLLFCSDGTNGAYKYDGSAFRQMGIAIPSAPTAASDGAGNVETGSYNYRISNLNTQAVEGEAGSMSVTVTLATTAAVTISGIPTAPVSHGIDARYIYRASVPTGPYRFVGSIADNTTTTFADSVGATTWAVAAQAIEDGTAPTPFTTIAQHREVLFFDDSSERTLLRYTESGNPFVSKAANFRPLNKGDKSDIVRIDVQDNLVTTLKDNSTWLLDMVDPADPLTWVITKSPSNYGIVGMQAATLIPNGLLFVGKQNGKVTGLHVLSGFQVLETADSKLRTRSISEKIEDNILSFPSNLWSKISLGTFQNRIYMLCAISGDTKNDHIYWFDINRIGSEGQPGSYSLWDGISGSVISQHEGDLYIGSSDSIGQIYKIEDGTYNDRGSAINSYFWTKEFGGKEVIESWIKDFRKFNLWYAKTGSWNMGVRYRKDGDSSDGNEILVDLTPGGSLWDTAIWGLDEWGGAQTDNETQHSFGTLLGRRLQMRFDNQDTANQYFKVHRLELLMNLRRQA